MPVSSHEMATAGILGAPLLRFDFGSVYDKYHGETERKLRESLQTADVMSPCVLWIDEIEKGIAGRGGETGTTQRVLGTFLTWLAERKSQVFVVATANNIATLPPELVRKGRFDIGQLAGATEGFSGAELEQAIVSALYAAHAKQEPLSTGHVLDEVARTRPLSVVMHERIAAMRDWAAGRTVPCD